MPDYSKTVIYKLCCNDTSIKDIYIGSTCNFTMRKYGHKSNCQNQNSRDYNIKVYQFIREHGGFQNWSMVMVHQESVDNKLQKERLERQFIEELKPSLNSNVPTRTKKEWKADNKAHEQQYQTQYYQDNKEQCNQRDKKYYQDNKEQLNQQRNQKFDCECGGKFTRNNKNQHLRSKKHQNYEKLNA